MLSPAGVVIKPEGFEFGGNVRKDGAKVKGKQKAFLKFVKHGWEKKWSPFGVMRKSGAWIGKSMIKSYITRRMGDTLNE